MSAELIRYEAARQALAEAVRVDEVKDIRDKAVAMEVYAKRAEDPTLLAHAAEIRRRAERRLGELMAEQPKAKPSGSNQHRKVDRVSEKPDAPVTLDQVGIDKNLASRARKAAALPPEKFEATIEAVKNAVVAALDKRSVPINGARSVMGSRQEPADSIDFFPTPPWATRALMKEVLPECLPGSGWSENWKIWEPACGEGHMSKVLDEFVKPGRVFASDIHDYCGNTVYDFLSGGTPPVVCDWIITNPPFSGKTDRALDFTLRALSRAKIGVAMFVRSQWAVEGVERYERLFSNQPPTLRAFFSERVNLCKGCWDPDGSTATAYCWLVWVKGQMPLAPLDIQPGCRQEFTQPDDRQRFAAWSLPPHDPETGEIAEAAE